MPPFVDSSDLLMDGPALTRIVQRDPRPDKVECANDMLAALDAARAAAR